MPSSSSLLASLMVMLMVMVMVKMLLVMGAVTLTTMFRQMGLGYSLIYENIEHTIFVISAPEGNFLFVLMNHIAE